jgi:hypothetical protein
MSSVLGENSDLFIKGAKIHIQTEDWGDRDQSLVSRIFKNGAVIKTYKLSYNKIPESKNPTERRKALIQFHQLVIDSAGKEIF